MGKLAKMPSKVPPNYFIYPEFRAIIGFPITWVLLPIAGFQPDLLAGYLPPNIFQSISKAQPIFAIIFKAILGIHAFELVYATYRCIVLELNFGATVKWLINVGFNGVFALKMLHAPEKFMKVE